MVGAASVQEGQFSRLGRYSGIAFLEDIFVFSTVKQSIIDTQNIVFAPLNHIDIFTREFNNMPITFGSANEPIVIRKGKAFNILEFANVRKRRRYFLKACTNAAQIVVAITIHRVVRDTLHMVIDYGTCILTTYFKITKSWRIHRLWEKSKLFEVVQKLR